MRLVTLLCLASTIAWGASEFAPEIHNLELVGQLPLAPGFNAGVWVHKNAAYVGTWGTATACPATGVKIVDITDPASPRLVGRLAVHPNTSTEAMVVRSVNTQSFRGDLLAVGVQACRNGQTAKKGVELFDVTDPRNPHLLSFFETGAESRGVHELDLIQRSDGRVLLLLATIARFRLIDATDPTHPRQVSDWSIAERTNEPPSSSKFVHSVHVSADGQMAFLSYWDAGVVLLDIGDPNNPHMVGRASPESAHAHSVSVSPERHLMLAANEDLDPGSASEGYNDWGYLRVFDVADPAGPKQIGAFVTANARTDRGNGPADDGIYSIRNALIAGGFGYLSWYSDGVRVVDLGNPRSPEEVASYVPPGTPDPFGVFAAKAQVWGVVTQQERNLVIASDINFGLYVLRPLEPKASERGVMNAASLEAGSPVAPGSIVTVLGSQLAATARDTDGSGSATLAGASVKVNGEPAQMVYASPGQINFVMPPNTPLGTASVTVENLGRPGAAISTQVVDAAPGLFTLSQDGRGPVAASRATDHSAITPQRPAGSGEAIFLSVSGLGVSNPAIGVSIGGAPAGFILATQQSNGISTLLVRVPEGVRGEASIVVTANGRSSNVATLPVQ